MIRFKELLFKSSQLKFLLKPAILVLFVELKLFSNATVAGEEKIGNGLINILRRKVLQPNHISNCVVLKDSTDDVKI